MPNDKIVENIALFDMDATLCDYDKAVKRDYDKMKAPSDPEYSAFNKEIESTDYLRNRIRILRNVPGWWQDLEKYAPGFEILNLAKDLGFSIHILTKGPRSSTNSWAEKVEWCKRNLEEYDVNITISEDKGLVYGKVLVDDYPEYVEQWLRNRPRGLVIMPLHEWNKNFKHDNVIHYNGNNIDEIKKALLKSRDRKANESIKYNE